MAIGNPAQTDIEQIRETRHCYNAATRGLSPGNHITIRVDIVREVKTPVLIQLKIMQTVGKIDALNPAATHRERTGQRPTRQRQIAVEIRCKRIITFGLIQSIGRCLGKIPRQTRYVRPFGIVVGGEILS